MMMALCCPPYLAVFHLVWGLSSDAAQFIVFACTVAGHPFHTHPSPPAFHLYLVLTTDLPKAFGRCVRVVDEAMTVDDWARITFGDSGRSTSRRHIAMVAICWYCDNTDSKLPNQ